MRGIALYCILIFLGFDLHAQKGEFTITADNVLMTSCDSTELTLRNHTDTVPGFLFNNGDGHTVFKRGLQKLSNGSFVIGGTIADNGSVLQGYGSSCFSNAVRFAGLTQDSTQTRVLVSDDSGNVYCRSASSLALDNPIRTSLALNGIIKSKNIIISPDDWADYVFDSTYRLPDLAVVESYIHREHHLPGIPSAETVRKEGLDVGASQAALLKKIEELTLYTIEQKREIDEMKARIEKLENLLLDKAKEK